MNQQAKIIDEMFKYNLWANTQIINLCSQLNDDQLQVDADGVFGRILPIISHIVHGEGAYIRHLTGYRPWADDLDWEAQSMQDLLTLAQQSGTRLIELASKTDPDVEHIQEEDGIKYLFDNSTVLIQALYHGIEHRTQIKV
ncbi:MAG: putative damage-inducible protein DinB, partial [Candidatus Promineifilaceae bacterium]